jgi:GMP synthase-like glutamine amidotransferase
MKIGVLAAGITPEELIDQHGSYAQMIINLLNTTDTKFEFEVFDVRLDQFPADLSQFDGWAISGSKNNVSENLPWMSKLKILILDAYRSKQPIVGICFGHQIIADAFGGVVDRYEGGWGLGLHTYQLTPGYQSIIGDDKEFSINAVHQDQVINKPDNSEVIAKSDFCKNAGLIYDDLILTFQAHPEFNMAFEKDLVEFRSGTAFPLSESKAAIASLEGKQSDSKKVASWFSNFLMQAR